jgi:ABC-type transport system substrate-binding protein
MKKRNLNLICLIAIFFFLTTPFYGLVPSTNAQQTSQATTENSLIVGVGGSTPNAWDPAIRQADAMVHIKDSALERLVWQDTKGKYHPMLAESWTIHERPEGISAAGLNEGGIAAYEFKLQEGVTFHDGSAFNASVAKWNIDRIIQISGYENRLWSVIHWMNPAEYTSRFTADWDLSWALNDAEISLITTADPATIDDGDHITYTALTASGPQDYYIWFDKTGDGSADPAPGGRLPIYVNISAATTQLNVSNALGAAIGATADISASNTANNVTITNQVEGGVPDIADVDSGLAVSVLQQGVIRNPFGTSDPEYIPIINETIVVSEYVLNVTMNKWYTDLGLFMSYGFISQEAYGPWFNTSINGYEAVPNAPDGTPFPGHMIGTGPYKFESVDFVFESKAHASRFDNYWNATALQAHGGFEVTDIYVRFFADLMARGNAILATDVDYITAIVGVLDPTSIADIKASPYLQYIPTVPDVSVNVIFFQMTEGINEPLAQLGGQSVAEWFPNSTLAASWGLPPGTELPGGLNKTVRRAVSYAYDYTGFVAAVYPDTSAGGIHCWSPWGMSSPFTQEGAISHPGPDPDLTTARQILLNNSYYAGQLAARRLSLTNTTAEWNAIAASNPIRTYKYLCYPGQITTDFITEALENLGFGIDVREDAADGIELWTHFVRNGRSVLYDIQPYSFLMNPLDPAQYGPFWYSSWAARLPNDWAWAFNYPHLRNATVDAIFSNSEFLADKQDSYTELADILINKEVPAIYESQGTMGISINVGFTFPSWATEVGGPAIPRIAKAALGGSRLQATTFPPISSYPTSFMILTMIVSSIGIIYIIKHKRK